MKKNKTNRFFKQERRRIYTHEQNGPYRENEKYPEGTLCSGCGALFSGGRWTWNDIPEQTNSAVCPACRRIADNYPAGIIEMSGDFLGDHRTEIMNLVRNTSSKEVNEHPMERIMKIDQQNGSTVVSTTGMHLARRIGDALFSAYEGELDYNYDAETLLRVFWKR